MPNAQATDARAYQRTWERPCRPLWFSRSVPTEIKKNHKAAKGPR